MSTVKKIIFGTPIRKVQSSANGAGHLDFLDGVKARGTNPRAHKDILMWDSSQGLWVAVPMANHYGLDSTGTSTGINIYYSQDSDYLRLDLDSAVVKSLFSAGGDIAYDSATGQFSLDVDVTYTKANFDSDLNIAGGRIQIGTNRVGSTDSASTIAIGRNAGTDSQGNYSIAIGDSAGANNQGANPSGGIPIGHSISIGRRAGRDSQENYSIAIGDDAGQISQGNHAIAIGTKAGQDSQVASSIILNAQSTALNAKANAGLYVDPIRGVTDTGRDFLRYDTSTKEVVYSADMHIDSAHIDALTADSARINDLHADSATILSGVATFQNLHADSAHITTLTASAISFNDIDIDSADFGYFSADSGLIRDKLSFANLAKAAFGKDSSIQIYIDSGAGRNYFNSKGSMKFQHTGADRITYSDTVTLYADGAAVGVLSTNAYGVTVYGNFISDSATIDQISVPDGGTSGHRINIGTGDDLKIYHDGSNSYIADSAGTGSLNIVSSQVNIQGTGETLATFVDDGGVTLYHNNVPRVYSTDSGATVAGNLSVTGSYLKAPSTFYIDPATIGNDSGKVVVMGDFQVNGTTTTINSTTVQVDDKNILLGDSASDSSASNGAGITVQTSKLNPSILYNASNDRWEFNKPVYSADAVFDSANISSGKVTLDSAAITKLQISGELTWQDSSWIKIGNQAGLNGQQQNAIAIGYQSANYRQGVDAIAIGQHAGQWDQGSTSVAIGQQAGQDSQSIGSVAIGYRAGEDSQGARSVSIGHQAGYNGQNEFAIAIGDSAGKNVQKAYSIAIGAGAGSILQGEASIAIGQEAGSGSIHEGTGSWGQNARGIAIGKKAGKYIQGADNIAIGTDAGLTYQGKYTEGFGVHGIAIAIGRGAGQTNQGYGSVAIGDLAGQNAGGKHYTVAIGGFAGQDSQGTQAIAIGAGAGREKQGSYGLALGDSAGRISQGINTVAIGHKAGRDSQNQYSIAIGFEAGKEQQDDFSVAIGTYAGATNQGDNAIAISYQAGNTNQGNYSIALGAGAGQNNQTFSGIAIGRNAAEDNQDNYGIAIGYEAGEDSQGEDGIAIGRDAASTRQGEKAISIGYQTALSDQGDHGIAIGTSAAGHIAQATKSIAIGYQAGWSQQGRGVSQAIAIGDSAGMWKQDLGAIAIGGGAGRDSQDQYAVAIGHQAGHNEQGANSIAIGKLAGHDSQVSGSIILNASGGLLNAQSNAGLYVDPVRQDSSATQLVGYNTTTKELTTSIGVVHGFADSSFATADSDQVLDIFTAATYRTAKYVASVTTGSNKYMAAEIMLMHDSASAYTTTYGILTSDSALGTFDAIISGSDVRLLWSPHLVNSRVKLEKRYIIV